MSTILKLLPLAVLIAGAFLVVWRGLRLERHDKGKIKGGGPDFPERNF